MIKRSNMRTEQSMRFVLGRGAAGKALQRDQILTHFERVRDIIVTLRRSKSPGIVWTRRYSTKQCGEGRMGRIVSRKSSGKERGRGY